MPTLAQQALGWGVHTLGLGETGSYPRICAKRKRNPDRQTVAGGTKLSLAFHPSLRHYQSDFHGMLRWLWLALGPAGMEELDGSSKKAVGRGPWPCPSRPAGCHHLPDHSGCEGTWLSPTHNTEDCSLHLLGLGQHPGSKPDLTDTRTTTGVWLQCPGLYLGDNKG